MPPDAHPPSSARLRIGAACLALGAALLVLAWALMPDAGTADAAHILVAVGAMRDRVRVSALVQLLASALFAPGVLAFAGRGRTLTFVGGALLLIGAMGMAADAVYHQLAVEMTAPGTDVRAMLPAMTAMQTRDIRSLVPLLLAFIAGAPALVLGMVRDGRAARSAAWLVYAAGTALVLGGAAAAAGLIARQLVVLALLGLLAAALGVAGVSASRTE